MTPLVLDDADTMLSVTIKVGDAEVTQTLDLARVSLECSAISKKADKDNIAWLEGVADYLQACGFPRPSLTTANRFWNAISAAMQVLKKKDGELTTPA